MSGTPRVTHEQVKNLIANATGSQVSISVGLLQDILLAIPLPRVVWISWEAQSPPLDIDIYVKRDGPGQDVNRREKETLLRAGESLPVWVSAAHLMWRRT